ncbi:MULTISPECIES: ABC transporter permease subunit [unclassified Staphylococcus]|uniref:ABC transporter substrate-binding protein/permease n=1 Tax=unclassified Staphylococcus TaxID=91994 RepID=UPI0021D10F15|nr:MULTISPECIES: ABC transporter permease subunit [unclassified Staphylococcus]UXR71009.1 ABC transporter permease subunit [Staphylococcus sp. IVB6240]UXR75535.1 ABC transporter permease subunit [Staphylococcus sp. IVB6233]UXR79737.1 ABC transporter permease subunit [Staphylococcus sp. IVB6218]
MKYIQKLGCIAFVLAILLSTLPLGKPAYAADDKWKKIEERGELRVGLSADYAPMEFERTINGKREYAGIDIELAKKIADDHGLKLTIVNMQFDSLLGALKTGKIDMIISGMTPTSEREKEVDFSDSYMTVKQTVVIRKKDADKYKTLDDLTGKRIGAQKQTTQEELAQTEIKDADVQSLTRLPEVILSLKSNKIDGVVMDSAVADAYLKQNDDLVLSKVEFANSEKQTAVAVPKNSPELLANVNATVAEVNDKNLIDKYAEKAAQAMKEDGSFFAKYGTFFLTGLKNTILISIMGVFFGANFGALFALMKISSIKPLKWLASAYIEFLRGTPLLVQVFLVYFGTTAVLGLDISAFICGTIALVINCSAYIAEIIRAGINAVDKGQMEAARSLGLSYGQTMKTVIMPQAVKNILPALGNEFVTVIKESSIVSVIGVSEIMFNSQVVQGASFDPFTPLLIAAVLYFILTFMLSRVMNFFEGRLSVSD